MEAFFTVNEAGRDRSPWLVPNYTLVAQWIRATYYEHVGRRFESFQECQNRIGDGNHLDRGTMVQDFAESGIGRLFRLVERTPCALAGRHGFDSSNSFALDQKLRLCSSTG